MKVGAGSVCAHTEAYAIAPKYRRAADPGDHATQATDFGWIGQLRAEPQALPALAAQFSRTDQDPQRCANIRNEDHHGQPGDYRARRAAAVQDVVAQQRAETNREQQR